MNPKPQKSGKFGAALVQACIFLFITAWPSALEAANLSVTAVDAVDEPDYDLTLSYGLLDWAYWNGADTPSNEKAGASLIGSMSPVGGGELRTSTSTTNVPVYDFVFSDGTSPASGSISNLIGNFNTQLDTGSAGVRVEVTAPSADPFTIFVWATAYRSVGTLTATVGSVSDSAAYTNGETRAPGAFIWITVEPDSAGQTVELVLTGSDGANSSSNASLAAVALIDGVEGWGGASIGVEQPITAITASGSTLTTITYAGSDYGTLTSPASFVDTKGSTDWLHLGSTAPASLGEACGSLDLGTGSLNQPFQVQFGGLTDSSLVFLLCNGEDDTQSDSATVYPIDAAGNRLGGVSSTISFGANNGPGATPFPELTILQTYNRTTDGAPNGTLNRLLVGMAFTLEDLAFGGLSATGLEFETTTLDLQEIGLAQSTGSADPKITSFTAVGENVWELTLAGSPSTIYQFRSSTTLDFAPGNLVDTLTQENPETDPGTIGVGNDQVTTDGNGDAKVRMTLAGNPADFVRAQSVP